MYPTPLIARCIERDDGLIRRVWQAINDITTEHSSEKGESMAADCTSSNPES